MVYIVSYSTGIKIYPIEVYFQISLNLNIFPKTIEETKSDRRKQICFACQISYYTLSILYIFVISIPSIHFSIFNLRTISFDHYQIIFQDFIASYTIKVIGGLCYTKYKINIETKNLRRIHL